MESEKIFMSKIKIGLENIARRRRKLINEYSDLVAKYCGMKHQSDVIDEYEKEFTKLDKMEKRLENYLKKSQK